MDVFGLFMIILYHMQADAYNETEKEIKEYFTLVEYG